MRERNGVKSVCFSNAIPSFALLVFTVAFLVAVHVLPPVLCSLGLIVCGSVFTVVFVYAVIGKEYSH